MDKTRYTYVLQHPANGRLLQPVGVEEPNPKCVVCGNARVNLTCDTNKFTQGDLIAKVLKKRLCVNLPSVHMGEVILHEEGDDLDEEEVEEYEALGKRVLSALPGGGVKHGSVLMVEDFSQDMKFELMISHREDWDEEKEPEGFVVSGEDVKPKESTEVAEAAPAAAAAAAAVAVAADDDDMLIVDKDIHVIADNGKRKRADDEAPGADDDSAKEARID
jgi:ubiquitin-like 1-activating enzyme E1 B